MNIQSMSVSMEKYVMPLANKLGNEIHLRAIRDAFMSLLPITFTGGIAAVLSSAPSVDAAGTGITLAWARFVESNSMIFSWINALTLGAMSLYICIGIIHFLCKSRKIESFLPILLGVCGFLMLIVEPMSLGWDGKMAELSYMDGKGLIPAMFISILTADLYCYMRKRDFGKISLPDTVPASLSDVFASIVPGAVLMVIYIALYAIMNKAGTTLPKLIYNAISPSLTAADSVGFTIIITLMVHIFWFFGIHDAALSGVLAPIRDGNLSINAAAHAAGQALPSIFTTPFWVYFVVIGGCGSVLALTALLCFSKFHRHTNFKFLLIILFKVDINPFTRKCRIAILSRSCNFPFYRSGHAQIIQDLKNIFSGKGRTVIILGILFIYEINVNIITTRKGLEYFIQRGIPKDNLPIFPCSFFISLDRFHIGIFILAVIIETLPGSKSHINIFGCIFNIHPSFFQYYLDRTLIIISTYIKFRSRNPNTQSSRSIYIKRMFLIRLHLKISLSPYFYSSGFFTKTGRIT